MLWISLDVHRVSETTGERRVVRMVSTYPSAKRLGSSSSLFSFAVTTSLLRGVLKVTVEGSNGSHEGMTIRAMSAMII